MDKDKVPGFWEEVHAQKISSEDVEMWKEIIKQTIIFRRAATKKIMSYVANGMPKVYHSRIIMRCIRILLAGFRPSVKIQMLKDIQEIIEKRGY